MSKFTTIDAFIVNVDKSSFPEIVHEQSESASFVTLVEIHNVDVPAGSSRDATVLSPTAGTLQWPSSIMVKFEIESLIRAPIHTHNRRVRPTISSNLLIPQLKQKANHERLGCAQCSKFSFLSNSQAILNLDGCCFIKEVIFECITFKTSYVTECYVLHLQIMSICKARDKLFIVCPYLNPVFYLFYFYLMSCFTFSVKHLILSVVVIILDTFACMYLKS